ncbi:MAG TPA: DUF6580 family putative transport protein [Patescibacteria group bacterium]|jgi:hypothetical protein|nr:DUF6580 family putative transport protein [Patescibacteria group bacterium]
MLAYFFILLGALLRVVPHSANFAPIAAMALFGGVYLSKKQALLVPLAAMVISDFFIGFDSLQSRLAVYGSFILIGALGLLIRNRKNIATVLGGTVLGSVLFFLITNLVYLYPSKMYPHTFAGQIASYTNAIPFFRNTLFGDLFYVAVLFGSYELVMVWQRRKSYAKSHSG